MRIYVVNCNEGRAARLLSSAEPLKLHTDIEIVAAPLGTDEEVLRRGKTCFERGSSFPTGVAATLGHMRAMRRVVESGDRMAMIVEDDVRFHKDFHRKCAIVEAAMEDVDVFTTGYVAFPCGTEEEICGLKVVKNVPYGNPWGAQGYVITAEYARRFLAIFEADDLSGPYSGELVADRVIFDQLLGCRRHTLVDPIVVEDPDEQTIVGSNNKPPLFGRLTRDDYWF